MMTKQAHAAALKKIAAIEAIDRNNAFEIGFAKCAQDLGLDETQFGKLYKIALEMAKTEQK